MPFLRNEFSKSRGPFFNHVILKNDSYLWSNEKFKIKAEDLNLMFVTFKNFSALKYFPKWDSWVSSDVLGVKKLFSKIWKCLFDVVDFYLKMSSLTSKGFSFEQRLLVPETKNTFFFYSFEIRVKALNRINIWFENHIR